ncbi:winged helix-turn-helix transcriptional regulator [Aeromicrobium ginsengisoli]|uniref:Helix-turn-helix transcriptional regulator n=1 Tax=Aeromicrobium ginsengisoli TaxID=363867 RepID=A0A5M4FD31_9ACTN|nr:helix-turn-helix domain-containing protein [Aeromicrobium ginsengisoli]KAA1397245.1 helix-turn-helix transcriptional regulator [Aeromicrobium ginsengisoli]
MKSYQQYCSVARALDSVGDRWVLLIVRELLAFGPSRYSDLKRGLPGIATNLLAERLKAMEADGLVEHREAPAPIGSRVYQLTERGRDLEDVVRALSRWSLPAMPSGPRPADAVQPQWIALLAGLNLAGNVAPGAELVLLIDTGDAPVRARLRNDGFGIDRLSGDGEDVALRGDAVLVGGLLTGLLSVEQATELGLTITGHVDQLNDLIAATQAGATA